MGWIKPTEADLAAQRAVQEEITSAIAAAMTTPWRRQTATFTPDAAPKQPKEEG